MTKAADGSAINSRCPWSGDPVSDTALTQYRGQTIGFCNPGCRDKFETATRAFDRALAERAATDGSTVAIPSSDRTPGSTTGLPYRLRDARPDDAAALHRLMRGLAKFEGYIDDFRVTEADIAANGFGKAPSFRAFVGVDDADRVVGMAVTYRIDWTYDLRPTVVLKELFVEETVRGQGVGEGLLKQVARYAGTIGAARLQWAVLPDNHRSRAFYRRHGGQPDRAWEHWGLDANGLEALSRV
ncbi:MAG: GNAT family N-acetyltransferase [Pseudomonadota bacterium]